MARLKNTETGVTVSVRDGKALGRGWEPVEDEGDGSEKKPARRRSPRKKATTAPADDESEDATAYVSRIPSFKGFAGRIADES